LPAQRLFGQLQLGHPLPIDSIVATHTGVDVSSLHDGNLTTRWRVRPEETLNDRLEINLREAAPIESVQIDLGAYRTEYPRQLRLDIISDSGRPRTVWDGGAAGLAMFGVLSNYMSPTMTIDVVPSMVGRKIVLIVPVQHPPVAWSVADIRVIGQ
jgi:hypothetical protein